jgi:membrane-bound lytic murein transglycosylase F
MKWLFYLSFVFVFLVACSSEKKQIDESDIVVSDEPIPPVDLDLEEILERGYINAAVDYSSTSYFVYRGEILGFEYELLRRLEDYFKIKVNITVQPSIEESIKLLNKGEVDIIAYALTINKARKKIIAFTDHYNTQTQVLVQRKPDNWRAMKLHEIEKTLLRDQVDLIDKEIHVLNSSSYIDALESLSEQIGGDINIIEEDPSVDTEQLIKNVAEGVYNYTISDENIAIVNHSYYPNIDIETPVSFPRRVAWAVRRNSTELPQRFEGRFE